MVWHLHMTSTGTTFMRGWRTTLFIRNHDSCSGDMCPPSVLFSTKYFHIESHTQTEQPHLAMSHAISQSSNQSRQQSRSGFSLFGAILWHRGPHVGQVSPTIGLPTWVHESPSPLYSTHYMWDPIYFLENNLQISFEGFLKILCYSCSYFVSSI